MNIEFDSVTDNGKKGILRSYTNASTNACFLLRGFYLSYGDNDHHIEEIEVKLSAPKYNYEDNALESEYTCNMKDDSGNEAKQHQITATVISEIN